MNRQTLERRIHLWLIFYIAALAFWGVTTFPLAAEMEILYTVVKQPALNLQVIFPALVEWIGRVNEESFRFISYAAIFCDWAH
ncbi:MAG: hypothetical protein HY741_18700 [Chloroflexi bacterium]|nr:hypothetical protein [Chloroflexota bacterium]